VVQRTWCVFMHVRDQSRRRVNAVSSSVRVLVGREVGIRFDVISRTIYHHTIFEVYGVRASIPASQNTSIGALDLPSFSCVSYEMLSRRPVGKLSIT
jgi:hypothetical protein